MLKRYQSMMERPKFPQRDLAQMLNDLIEINPEEWGIYAFSRDPLHAKFQNEERKALAGQALLCGQTYARRVVKEHGSDDPLQLLKKLGVKVKFVDIPENTDRVLFAEFLEPDEVFVYTDAIDRAKRLMEDRKVRQALTAKLNLRRTLLSHELFHVLEIRDKKEIFTQTYRHQLWKAGPLKNASKVLALGEIAAMAFAQELCGLPYSVYVIDVLLLSGYSDNEASGLYEEMMNCVGRKPCRGLSRLEALQQKSSVLGEAEDASFE